MRDQREKRCLQLAAALILTLGLAFTLHVRAEAALAAPTGLKEISVNTTQMKIGWDDAAGTESETVFYYVEYSDDASFAAPQIEASLTNSLTISGLDTGKTYYVRVGVSSTFKAEGYPDDTIWSAVYEAATTPDHVSVQYTGAQETSISLAWSSVEGATGYIVYYCRTDTPMIKTMRTTALSVTIDALTKNATYDVYVAPLRKTKDIEVSGLEYGFRALPTLPTQIRRVDCDGFDKTNSAGFTWKKNSAADGYQYIIYSYNGKKLLSGYTTNNWLDIKNNKKLKKHQFYKIKVSGYVILSGGKKKIGKASDYEWFAQIGRNDVKASTSRSGEKVKLSWKKVAGAKNYTIFWSTSASGRFEKLATVKHTRYTITRPTNYYQDYYVRVIPNRKSGKKTYSGILNSKSDYSIRFQKRYSQ